MSAYQNSVKYLKKYIPVHLKAAIEGLQARKPSWFSIWSTLEGLDPGSPEDQELYVSKVLPEILGENIARMHNANCQHGYLHAGNITLAGEIVDLDSVYAKTLFEDEKEAFTFKDTLHDIEVAMRSLAELTDFEVCQPTDGIDGFESVLRRFFLSYFAERYPDLSRDGSDETESIILEYLSWAYGDGSLEGYEEPRIVDPGKILDRVDSAIIEGNDPQAIMIAVLKEIEEKVIEWLEPIDRQSSFIRNIANPASIALLEFAKIIKISDLNILKLTQPHLIEAVFY